MITSPNGLPVTRFYSHVRAHNWLGAAIDFLIVVVGVYVAMWASDMQSARLQRQRTAKVVDALRQDLRDSLAVEKVFDDALEKAFSGFDAARQRGEMPPPVFLRISGSDVPPRSPCQGVLQEQLAEVIEPELLFELCFYYDERDGLGQKYVRYAVFLENEILPRMKQTSQVFYMDGGQRLAPAFEAHMDRLQEWRRESAVLREWSRCLDGRLSAPSSSVRSCRPTVGGTVHVEGAKQGQ
ncbi:hypothetical protein BH18ACI5_BH18ACI5_09390 [soil metagenome]